MTAEELLLRFQAAYPGVYLCVKHEVRLLEGRPKHEWTLWHNDAGEHVGPYAEPHLLAMAVTRWEESGERAAACQIQEAERIAQQRRERLARDRLAAERSATRVHPETCRCSGCMSTNDSPARLAEAARVADPSYIPTLEEAVRNPIEFVEGMTETAGFHSDPRD